MENSESFVKMSFKYSFIICILSLFVVRRADGQSCYVKYNERVISDFEWIYGIDIVKTIRDVEPRYTRILDARCANIQEVKSVTVNNKPNKYVNTLLSLDPLEKNVQLIIALNKEFEQYEEHETSNVMKINVTFLCDDGKSKSLEIRQRIDDTNNHNPEFLPSYYTFSESRHLPADYLIGKISARDVDLENKYITFSFKSNNNNIMGDFALLGTYQDSENRKVFHTWFVTTKEVYLTRDLSFIISIQDSGEPKRSWSAVADIKVSQWTTTSSSSPSWSWSTSTLPSTTGSSSWRPTWSKTSSWTPTPSSSSWRPTWSTTSSWTPTPSSTSWRPTWSTTSSWRPTWTTTSSWRTT